ncbi:hypothetical protein [Jeotgalibacillus campisalis]|uniref:Uncharacterized protein n=1 Tax=Jeotgalibacillus campisalis TaxID=220754 RepID=A0A0C2RDL5_9BACL|nr:hypothetical protein [Jeotgalibacillus campisalis]KIL48355.1 hypothetical protein KR50_13910 [Jeotgalibacillus campisalis]
MVLKEVIQSPDPDFKPTGLIDLPLHHRITTAEHDAHDHDKNTIIKMNPFPNAAVYAKTINQKIAFF